MCAQAAEIEKIFLFFIFLIGYYLFLFFLNPLDNKVDPSTPL